MVTNWAYNRGFHLVLLVILLALYAASWISYVAFKRFFWLYGLEWGLAAALFVFLWFLRGLPALSRFFPWFHYGTLIVEWTAHLIRIVAQVINLVTYLLEGRLLVGASPYELVIIATLILIDINYLLLIYKCARVKHLTFSCPYINSDSI